MWRERPVYARPRSPLYSRFPDNDHFGNNGALYAYMVRTWTWFFGLGLLSILVGFFALLCKQSFGERLLPDDRWSMSILIGGALLVIIVVLVMYRRLRPGLGIVD